MGKPMPTPFPPERHDHRSCIAEALAQARAVCAEQGGRLTPQRQQILELVWREHKPVGAYELLERLREAGVKAAPPTVYRALDFLLAHGLIHRIESLNAFTGCSAPGTPHHGQFLVCSQCRQVAELDDTAVNRRLDARARQLGFVVEHQTVEISGLCPRCREEGDE
ncbi:MAG TPA: Fur family transcriptional regulator [Gammaproteobacteria bacterium]|jgi:Fur family zinc uptake transcriptional regulator